MADSCLRVLALEPYYGGSHRAFLDTWIGSSRHAWTLETLPARHWKWRMRGSAMWFAQRLEQGLLIEPEPAGGFDALFTCDMTSVADLRALLPNRLARLPIICYFHENQLTYPLSPTDWRDYQYGFTNITSALTANAVWFNSAAHRDAFLDAADALLRKMSDFVPREAIQRIRDKSSVQYPPVEVPPAVPSNCSGGPLRILWSHRWEYDKNPEAFFRTMFGLQEADAEFELVLVGEQFRTVPDAFKEGFARLAPHIAHSGYLESRTDYLAILGTCDVVVSTAIQENFGLAVVEAILAGCYPLLPNRLSYPELLPDQFWEAHLYTDDADLMRCLRSLAANPATARRRNHGLRSSLADRFGSIAQVGRLDDGVSDVAVERHA